MLRGSGCSAPEPSVPDPNSASVAERLIHRQEDGHDGLTCESGERGTGFQPGGSCLEQFKAGLKDAVLPAQHVEVAIDAVAVPLEGGFQALLTGFHRRNQGGDALCPALHGCVLTDDLGSNLLAGLTEFVFRPAAFVAAAGVVGGIVATAEDGDGHLKAYLERIGLLT